MRVPDLRRKGEVLHVPVADERLGNLGDVEDGALIALYGNRGRGFAAAGWPVCAGQRAAYDRWPSNAVMLTLAVSTI